MIFPKSAATYALVPTMASRTVYWRRSAYLLHMYVHGMVPTKSDDGAESTL